MCEWFHPFDVDVEHALQVLDTGAETIPHEPEDEAAAQK